MLDGRLCINVLTSHNIAFNKFSELSLIQCPGVSCYSFALIEEDEHRQALDVEHIYGLFMDICVDFHKLYIRKFITNNIEYRCYKLIKYMFMYESEWGISIDT